jgi:hypothetical protein
MKSCDRLGAVARAQAANGCGLAGRLGCGEGRLSGAMSLSLLLKVCLVLSSMLTELGCMTDGACFRPAHHP